MPDTHIVLTGNLTRDPELRFAESGVAVCRLGLAVNERVREGDQWVDGEPSFFNVTAFRDLAERVGESFNKGDRVIVIGKIKTRQYEPKDSPGEKRTATDITADEIGASVRWATVTIERVGGSKKNGSDPGDLFDD